MSTPSKLWLILLRMRKAREFWLGLGILGALVLIAAQTMQSWRELSRFPEGEDPTFSSIDLTQLEWTVWRGTTDRVESEVRRVPGFPVSLNHLFEIEPTGLAGLLDSPPVNDFTLEATFTLSETENLPQLGLALAELGENWEIFVNGRLVRSEMFRGADGEILIRRSVQKIIIRLPAPALREGNNILHFHFVGTAPITTWLPGWAPGFPVANGYEIANLEQLQSERKSDSGLTLLQIGMYLFFGIYEILFYLRRRENLDHLILAAYLLCFGGGWLYLNSSLAFDLYPDTTLITRLSYFSSVAATVILLFIWFFFYPKAPQPAWLIWFGRVLFVTELGILALPFTWIEPLMRLFLYTLPLGIAAGLYLTIQAWRARLPDSGKILAVVVFASILSFWDFLDIQFIHSGIILARITPFITSTALVLIQIGRFWKLQEESERLNQALRASKETLEEQVRMRTAELSEEVLQRAEARQEAEARAIEAETLQKAISAVTGTLEPLEMIDQILEQLARVVLYDSASVQLLRPDNNTEVIAGRGFENIPDFIGKKFPQSPNNLTGAVYQTLQPMVLDDVTKEFPDFLHPNGITVRGWMVVPLVARGQAIGHLTLDSYTANHFDDHSARLAMAYADQVALALQNAEAYQEVRRRAGELETFYEIGLAISSGLEMDRVLHTIYTQVRRIADLDTFYVALYDQEHGLVSFPILEDRGQMISTEPIMIQDKNSLTGWVIEHRQTLSLDDIPEMPEPMGLNYEMVGEEVSRSYVGVPMVLRERVVGVISMQSYSPNRFTANQVRLLETIANQAAIAIDNSRLYQIAQQELNLRRNAEDSLRQLNAVLESQLREISGLQTILREQAIRDALTGLFNRRYMEETMVRELARAQREGHPVGVIMMDIDHFKSFNDTFGHKAGDKVLIGLGELLRRISRRSDVACRYGGEELVLILPDASLENASLRAENVRQEFEKMEIACDGAQLQATISLGVAVYPRHGEDPESLLHKADEALYRAKQAGRNQVKLAD